MVDPAHARSLSVHLQEQAEIRRALQGILLSTEAAETQATIQTLIARAEATLFQLRQEEQ